MAYNDVRTPEQHAAVTGNASLEDGDVVYSVGHLGAAQMHGWEAHKRATTEVFTLIEGYYLEAIEAALAGGAPYESALSPYANVASPPAIGPGKHLVTHSALEPWVTFEDIELPPAATQVYDYTVRAYGYRLDAPTTRVNEIVALRVTRDGSGDASLLTPAEPFADTRLRLTVSDGDITVDVRAHATQDWVWDTEVTRGAVGSASSITLRLPNGDSVAVGGIVARGATVTDGILNLDGSAVTESQIEPDDGTVTLWSYAVPDAITLQVSAALRCTANNDGSGSRCIGEYCCVAHRTGSGALTIDAQGPGYPWVLSDPTWNPVFDTSSNTLRLRLTADATYSIVARADVAIIETDTSEDPVPTADPLAIARAAVLNDAPSALWYVDTGLTPSSPSPGDNITAIADQSGFARNLTSQAGDEPQYYLDGSAPYARFVAADGDRLLTSGGFTSNSTSMTIMWTGEKINNHIASREFLWYFGAGRYIYIHGSGTFGADGTDIVLRDGTNMIVLGACPTGKHDFEVRMNASTHMVTLYIDGVAGTPQPYLDGSAHTACWVGFDGTTTNAPAFDLYGAAIWNGASVTDDTVGLHWRTMSQLAWGAHD